MPAGRGSSPSPWAPSASASRILGGRYGAPFTFASPETGREAAPGQLPAAVLADTYRVRVDLAVDARLRPPRLATSCAASRPAIQNRAFAERGIDAVYVPLQAESMDAFAAALPALDLSGFSVTRPYKGDDPAGTSTP